MSSSGHGSAPTIDTTSVKCQVIQNPVYSEVNGVDASYFSWSATLTNVPDGILEILVNNPSAANNGGSTGVSVEIS